MLRARSSLPAEVYRDKDTLVEVTIHRRPREKENRQPSWAETLSDSDIHFAKPTKTSLARASR